MSDASASSNARLWEKAELKRMVAERKIRHRDAQRDPTPKVVGARRPRGTGRACGPDDVELVEVDASIAQVLAAARDYASYNLI